MHEGGDMHISNSAEHLRRTCCILWNLFEWITDNTEKTGKADRENLGFLIFAGMYLCTHKKEIFVIVHLVIFEVILKY